jgi:hypothetical protein
MWTFNRLILEDYSELNQTYGYIYEAVNNATNETTTFYKVARQKLSNDEILASAESYIAAFLNTNSQ